MIAQEELKKQLELFMVVLDQVQRMLETARNAFNQQSNHLLNELIRQRVQTEQEIALTTEKIDALLAVGLGDQHRLFIKLSSMLSHLQVVTEALGELALPMRKQITEGTPFSPRALTEVNRLFTLEQDILDALRDIFLTNNAHLKKLVGEEKGPELARLCFDFATEHEARMVEGLCLPHAAPIFLGILECFGVAARQEIALARLLTELDAL